MPKPIPLGVRGMAEETVEFAHTLTARHPELPPVYSTPDMIRLMETAAFHALQAYCEPGEITVGTAISIEHRAARAVEPDGARAVLVDAGLAQRADQPAGVAGPNRALGQHDLLPTCGLQHRELHGVGR